MSPSDFYLLSVLDIDTFSRHAILSLAFQVKDEAVRVVRPDSSVRLAVPAVLRR